MATAMEKDMTRPTGEKLYEYSYCPDKNEAFLSVLHQGHGQVMLCRKAVQGAGFSLRERRK